MRSFSPRFFLIAIISCLAGACGGGGGGGGGSQTLPASNATPELSIPSSVSVNEGESLVTTLTATDADTADVLSFSISGTDADALSIGADNQLSFSVQTDFQNPIDADGDNNYQVTITVEDGEGGSDSGTLTVAVINVLDGRVLDAPLSGSSVFIDLNEDLQQDADEQSVLTDSEGYFLLPDTQGLCSGTGLCEAVIVSTGGTDVATGRELPNLALFGVSASDASFVITPLSSLLLTAEDDEALLSALGLSVEPEDVTLLDPWEGSQNDQQNADDLLRVNQQVGLIIRKRQIIAPKIVSACSVFWSLFTGDQHGDFANDS